MPPTDLPPELPDPESEPESWERSPSSEPSEAELSGDASEPPDLPEIERPDPPERPEIDGDPAGYPPDTPEIDSEPTDYTPEIERPDPPAAPEIDSDPVAYGAEPDDESWSSAVESAADSDEMATYDLDVGADEPDEVDFAPAVEPVEEPEPVSDFGAPDADEAPMEQERFEEWWERHPDPEPGEVSAEPEDSPFDDGAYESDADVGRWESEVEHPEEEGAWEGAYATGEPAQPPPDLPPTSSVPPPPPGGGPTPVTGGDGGGGGRDRTMMLVLVAAVVLGLCAICAVAGAGIAFFNLQRISDAGQFDPVEPVDPIEDERPEIPDQDPPPPPPDNEIETTSTSVFDLEVGDCFNDDPGGEFLIDSVPLVSCNDPHDNEVFAVIQYPAGPDEPFPSEEELDNFSSDQCLAEFESYVGIAYDASRLAYLPLQPTEDSWTEGNDREILCILYDGQLAKLIGSMRGAQE